MKIAGEYSPGKATPKHVEQLAEEADLAKPMVKRGVLKPSETILATLPGLDLADPLAEAVAALMRQRSERAMNSFRR